MRIRTIKPEYWQDEKLAPLLPIDRLVFLGLISMADDAGRLVDNVRAIDGFLFGETEDTAAPSLTKLAELGRIERYVSSSGQKLIQIVGWRRHQKVDNPSRYTLPGPPGAEDDAPASRPPRQPRAKGDPEAGEARTAPAAEPRDGDAPPSRDPREDHATPSLSDQRPPSDDLRTASERSARGDEPPAPLPVVARSLSTATPTEPPPATVAQQAFESHFYAGAETVRRDQVRRQLRAVVSPEGAPTGERPPRVARCTLEQLDAWCEDLRTGDRLDNPDAAIAVLLLRVADGRVPRQLAAGVRQQQRGERAAAVQAERAADEAAKRAEDDARLAGRAERARAWARENPGELARLEAAVDAELKARTLSDRARAELRKAALLERCAKAADEAAAATERAPPAPPELAAVG